MIEPKIVYPCNHHYQRYHTRFERIRIEKFAQGERDLAQNLFLIPSNYRPLTIYRVFESDPTSPDDSLAENIKEYYDEIDFIFDPEFNVLEWNMTIQGSPMPNSLFMEAIFDVTTFYTHSREDCPRCAGHGWFGDIVHSYTKKNISEGSEKLTQEVIKILLTLQYDNYGTLLDSAMKEAFSDPEEYYEILMEMIKEAETEYKMLQLNAAGNAEIPPEELLDFLEVIEILYFRDSNTFNVRMSAHSQDGNISSFDFVL